MAAKAAGRVNWTRLETLAALHSPGSVALKLVNLASLDPLIVASGRSGMGNVSVQDRRVWSSMVSLSSCQIGSRPALHF